MLLPPSHSFSALTLQPLGAGSIACGVASASSSSGEVSRQGIASPGSPGSQGRVNPMCAQSTAPCSPAFVQAVARRWWAACHSPDGLAASSFLLFFFPLLQAKPWSWRSQWQNSQLFIGDRGLALYKWIRQTGKRSEANRWKLELSHRSLALVSAELILNPPKHLLYYPCSLKIALKYPNASFPLRVCMQPNMLRSRSVLQREADGLLSDVFSLAEHEYEKAFLFSKHMKVSNVEQSQRILICE